MSWRDDAWCLECEETLTRSLAAVREVAAAAVADPPVRRSEPARHVLAAGGKLVRARLVLLSGQVAVEGAHLHHDDALVRAAASIELLHAGTLVHDDVLDRSATRRGRPTVHALWGNRTAVLTGDLLLARAAALAADLDGVPPAPQARVLEELVRGEAEETLLDTAVLCSEAAYLRVVRGKTASLFELAARTGAGAGRVPPEATRSLARLGHHLGMAFQVVDDLEDLALPGEVSGKDPYADLRNRVASLPVVKALAAPGPAGTELRSLWVSGEVAAEPVLAAGLVRRAGGLAAAAEVALDHLDRCRAALSTLPGSAARQALSVVVSSLEDGARPHLTGRGQPLVPCLEGEEHASAR